MVVGKWFEKGEEKWFRKNGEGKWFRTISQVNGFSNTRGVIHICNWVPGHKYTRGVLIPILRGIQQYLKGMSFYKLTVGYSDYLETCDLCLKKMPHSRIIIDSPVYSSPGSQLRILITPRIFEKIQKCFLTCQLGPWEVVWRKKPETKNLVTLFL
jgi:hypothetical protein